MIEAIYVCDGCGKEVHSHEARDARWLDVSMLWSQKIDWEEDRWVFCSVACLVKRLDKTKK